MEIGDYYNLNDNQKEILSKEENNGFKNQYFKKENINWVVFDIDKEEVLLISDKPIEQTLKLSSKKDNRDYIEKINGLCKEVDRLCKEISGVNIARNLKEEDIIKSKFWEKEIKKNILFGEKEDFKYWLSSRCVLLGSSYCYFGLQNVYSGDVDCYSTFPSDGDTYIYTNALRPVVSIKLSKEV